MSRWASIRMTIYVAVLFVTAGLFIAAGVATWKKRDYWEKQIRQLQVDSVQFAQEYRAGFQELNTTLLRYRLGKDAADRARFQVVADGLSHRLAQLDRDAFVPESKEILIQLSQGFANYRKRAEALLDDSSASTMPDWLAQIDAASARVMALDVRLSAIQRELLASFVTRVRRDMDGLWVALYIGMALLMLSVAALAWVAYRDLIAPLRRAVVHSRALLEQREKLAALGLLTAGLAHEIRNPLNSIKARLFTQRRILGASSAGLEDNKCIEEEVDRLDGIVASALQFARPATPCFQRLRLQSALADWCGLLESSLCQADIRLKLEFQADPEINADLNQLKQAILNLVKNAAESIDRNGTITLRTQPALLRVGRAKQPAVAVEVEDTGKGIPAKVRQRLFDPFFTTKADGTGLGLSIAARIAHAHGGVIELGAPAGGGACFRIVLPA